MSGSESPLEKERTRYAVLLFPWQLDTTSSGPAALSPQSKWPGTEVHLSWTVGTGAVFSENLLRKVVLTGGEPFYTLSRAALGHESTRRAPLSAAEMLAEVRSLLSLTVTELAAILQVERPTIYSWLAQRAEPHPRNRRRLVELFSTAQVWGEKSELPPGDAIRWEDESGVSVVELLRKGETAEAEARLKSLADKASGQVLTGRQARQEKLRQFSKEHGLERSPEKEQTSLDVVTGKRIGPE